MFVHGIFSFIELLVSRNILLWMGISAWWEVILHFKSRRGLSVLPSNPVVLSSFSLFLDIFLRWPSPNLSMNPVVLNWLCPLGTGDNVWRHSALPRLGVALLVSNEKQPQILLSTRQCAQGSPPQWRIILLKTSVVPRLRNSDVVKH